jgi:phospholipid/cholesterol/gamma-HCH transport system substrate-binding protein
MLRRSTKIQLILFVVLTLVGVSYVSAEYVGLANGLFNSPCTVHADFKSGGGIFSNAEVTFRGVTVGRVGDLHLLPDGVRVDLDLDNCGSPNIPVTSSAAVADRSVIGEQYVNLVPPNHASTNGPYLKAGQTIPMSRTSTPLPTETLLLNLDDFVNSVPLNSLKTTVTELNNALSGRGDDLGALLTATNQLLTTASTPQNEQATTQLLRQAETVLGTQLDLQDPLESWTHDLNLISQQLKSSDPDIRHLLTTGPSDVDIIDSFVQDNRNDLGAVLANLATVGDVLVRHLPGIEQVLELYPALASGGLTVLHNNQAALSLVVQASPDPQDCGNPTKGSQGYNGTVIRTPQNLTPIAPNVAARCTAPASSGTDVRGAANIPGGDPISVSGAGVVYPRVVTQNVTGTTGSATSTGSPSSTAAAQAAAKAVPAVGTVLNGSIPLGDDAWYDLLTYALH